MAKSALILDFGGVVTKTLFELHRQTERNLGLAPGTLTWLGPLDPDTDELWRRVQLGELTERAYWRRRASEVGRLAGENWDDAKTMLRRCLGSNPNAIIRPEAARTIRRLKERGAKVAVLSNELDRFYGPELRSRLDLLSEMDAIVDGTHTDIFKPDPRAYELCLHALGANASEALFVDDSLRNVEGARGVGLDALHFDVRLPAAGYVRIQDFFP